MPEEIIFEAERLCIKAAPEGEDEITIVKDISFQVPRGSVVALIGESGSGKTTIGLSALGYCRPGLKFEGGQAKVLGRDVTRMSSNQLRSLRGECVAYLAQSAAAAFNPALRIHEQVTETAVQHGTMSQAEADVRALALYRALDLPNPETIGHRYPHQVSGGQLQRLMAAAALCSRPDLLVLDEPTTALDVTTQIEVLKSFKKVIKEEGAAAIYVTHDLAVVAQIADYIVVLYRGVIQEKGPVDVILSSPQHPYTKRLIAAVRSSPVPAGTEQPTARIPALEVKHVSAGYGKGTTAIPVLKDVNVTITRGHTVGIIGESGSGKSTLARVIAGLLPAQSGQIILDGKPIKGFYRDRSSDELRKIQFVFQMADTALNPKQRVAEIIGRPLQLNFGMRGSKKRERVAQLLSMVDLSPEFAHRYPHELSGGQKQRVNLARALAAEPEIMLCDEVTSALDTIVAAKIIALLKRLREETDVSFAFISHDLSTVASFADEIVVLYGGVVVEQGATQDVLSPPFHPYTRLLMSSIPEMRVGWLENTSAGRKPLSDRALSVSAKTMGCPFYNRCAYAIEGLCSSSKPPRRYVQEENGHYIECHRELEELM